MHEVSTHDEAVLTAIAEDLPGEPLVSSSVLAELRQSLVSSLQEMIASARPAELRLDAYRLNTALRCPASSRANAEPFRWSTLLSARTLALGALRELPEGQVDLVAGVRRRIADEIADGRSLGGWLGTLTPPANAAVVAAAGSWATRAWLAAPWRRLERVIFTPHGTWHWPLGRSNVVLLVGRPDAVVIARRAQTDERVLVRIGAHDEAAEGLDALVASLEQGRAPLRSVTISPATGDVSGAIVDEAVLERSVDRVERAVAILASGSDDPLERVPGPECAWCALRPECVDGGDWIARNDLVGWLQSRVTDVLDDES